MKYLPCFLAVLLSFLLTAIEVHASSKNFQSYEILFTPWGEASDQVLLTENPERFVGPQSFSVEHGQVALLDSENSVVKIYKSGFLRERIALPEAGFNDFIIPDLNDLRRYFLLKDNRVRSFRDGVETSSYDSPAPRQVITALFKNGANAVAVINDGASSAVEGGGYTLRPDERGVFDRHVGFVKILKHSWKSIVITTETSNIEISSDLEDLGLARFLGSTPQGHIYLYVERVVEHTPLRVMREIHLYTNKGQLNGLIRFESHAQSSIFREFYVDEEGALYQMISSKEGVNIIYHPFDLRNQDLQILESPYRFRDFWHFNEFKRIFPLDGPTVSTEARSAPSEPVDADYPPITSAEALAVADQYIVHEWAAEEKNLTDGEIEDSDGNPVKTPSWIKVGKNTKVPYRWGGFETPTQFDEGLLNGKYAGDIATSAPSAYAVGVDCSGFVSRSWKLPNHQSTSAMDTWDKLQTLDHWKNLKSGDAIHKVGHVRLHVAHNSNGSLQVAESSGADWRTSYRDYTYDQLTAYTAKHYINLQ